MGVTTTTASAATYVPLQTYTVGSTLSTYAAVNFTSIPNTYTDLVVVISGKLNTATANIVCYINNDSGTNYSDTYTAGNGSTVSSGSHTSSALMYTGGINSTSNNIAIYHFNNYANTTSYKTVISRCGEAGLNTQITTGLWRSTSAITQLGFGPDGNAWTVGSVFTLYGIKAA